MKLQAQAEFKSHLQHLCDSGRHMLKPSSGVWLCCCASIYATTYVYHVKGSIRKAQKILNKGRQSYLIKYWFQTKKSPAGMP